MNFSICIPSDREVSILTPHSPRRYSTAARSEVEVAPAVPRGTEPSRFVTSGRRGARSVLIEHRPGRGKRGWRSPEFVGSRTDRIFVIESSSRAKLMFSMNFLDCAKGTAFIAKIAHIHFVNRLAASAAILNQGS